MDGACGYSIKYASCVWYCIGLVVYLTLIANLIDRKSLITNDMQDWLLCAHL